MSSLVRPLAPASAFLYEKWGPLTRPLAKQYRLAAPFPHIRLAPFLEPEIAGRVTADFPNSKSAAWIHYKHGNEDKLGLSRADLFPASIREVVDELNSAPF